MQCGTRSPAVAKMADRTAPVVKLTLTLAIILPGPREWDGVSAHATAAKRAIIWQNRQFPLNGPIMRQNEVYWAIFCTLKTTSGFIFLLPVVWFDLATNRKPVGLVSKAIPAYLQAFWGYLHLSAVSGSIIVDETTSGFNSDRAIRQHSRGLQLESPFVLSSTDRWAVRATIRQKRPSGGRRGETGSRNMAATLKIIFLTLVSHSLLLTVFS